MSSLAARSFPRLPSWSKPGDPNDPLDLLWEHLTFWEEKLKGEREKEASLPEKGPEVNPAYTMASKRLRILIRRLTAEQKSPGRLRREVLPDQQSSEEVPTAETSTTKKRAASQEANADEDPRPSKRSRRERDTDAGLTVRFKGLVAPLCSLH